MQNEDKTKCLDYFESNPFKKAFRKTKNTISMQNAIFPIITKCLVLVAKFFRYP